MSVNMFKHPEVRIDVMVEKEFWPNIVSIIKSNDGSYFKEDTSEIKGKTYILIRDVKTVHAYNLIRLIGMISAFSEKELDAANKIYILIKPRKKVKKNVQKDRQETGTGSEGGNGGESGTDQPGEDLGSVDGGSEPVERGDNACVQLKMELPEVTGGDYDGDHSEFISEVTNEVLERVDPVEVPKEPEEDFIESPEYY